MGSYKLGNGVYGRGKGGEDHSYAKNERVGPPLMKDAGKQSPANFQLFPCFLADAFVIQKKKHPPKDAPC